MFIQYSFVIIGTTDSYLNLYICTYMYMLLEFISMHKYVYRCLLIEKCLMCGMFFYCYSNTKEQKYLGRTFDLHK